MFKKQPNYVIIYKVTVYLDDEDDEKQYFYIFDTLAKACEKYNSLICGELKARIGLKMQKFFVEN